MEPYLRFFRVLVASTLLATLVSAGAQVALRTADSEEFRHDPPETILAGPTEATPLAAGDVIQEWGFGDDLGFAWGIGYDLIADDLWLGEDIGTHRDYRYETDGTLTGDSIDISTWSVGTATDMTYNPSTGMLWQVNTDTDNCIYELDPTNLISTGNSICPDFGTDEDQYGLAYDPITDTFYTSSYYDQSVHHFDSDGNILGDPTDVGLSISGLAYNPGTGHLFALNNSQTSGSDVFVLDVNDDYAEVTHFDLGDKFGDQEQGGLAIDCDGYLWAVNISTKTVIQAESGETGVCSNGENRLTVTVDGSGSVVSDDGKIDCPSDSECEATYLSPTEVTLEAIPDSGSHFEGWGGACSGSGDCTIMVEGDVAVSASFVSDDRVLYVLFKSYSGTPNGVVTALSPFRSDVRCDEDCEIYFPPGKQVLLGASGDFVARYKFDHWAGDCSGKLCIVEMTEDRTVEAWFVEQCVGTVAVQGEADSRDWLSLLHAFRDKVLRGQPDSEWMVDAYYRHTGEVSARLISDGKLRARALGLLRRIRPDLVAAVAKGSLQFDPAAKRAISRFALTLQEGASEELVEDLRRFRREIQP